MTDRLASVRSMMGERGVDMLVLSPGVSWHHLVPFAPPPAERPTLLLITQGQIAAVTAIFDADEFREATGLQQVFGWRDDEGPSGAIADAFASVGAAICRSVAVEDFMPYLFYAAIEEHVAGKTIRPLTVAMPLLRVIKDAGEIEAIRASAELMDRMLEGLGDVIASAKTEAEVEEWLAGRAKAGGSTLPDIYLVQAGANSASPHHRPDDTPIRRGEPVLVDFALALTGYYADVTRNYHVGAVTKDYREVFDTVRAAQEAGVRVAKPGAKVEDIDRACRDVIEAAGYGRWFNTRTGHGIGMQGHEIPSVVGGNTMVLEEGMVVTIEPGIYIPGKFGVRIEDTVAITAAGNERLTLFDRDLVVVE